MNAYDAKVSTDTHDKIRTWFRLEKAMQRAQNQLNQVAKELQIAKQDLGTHLCPTTPSAMVGEKFNIWYGSGLLEIEYVTNSTEGPRYNISWRQEPSLKQLTDMA